MKNYPYEDSLEDIENQRYKDFESRIDKFVNKLLERYVPNHYSSNKVIHDPVWGTMMFYPWELQVLDSPLLQRLRKINQVGLAVLTYPSAHHTRFEHTLGVMSVVTKMVNNINQENYNSEQNNKTVIIGNDDLYKLRFAALMHDVGHCFFSHLSESIYGKLKLFKELKESFSIFSGAKEHEIFAFIIVNCKSFRLFFTSYVEYPFKTNPKRFLDDVGRMIIGAFIEPDITKDTQISTVKKYYLTQMINGPFDADKLDYLRRDCYTAGLALTYDIDRFLYKIKIVSRSETIQNESVKIIGKHLTIPITGISAVEEMAFSQLMLTSYIYQHQKVLATDALIKDIAEGMTKIDKLVHPCDYLKYCDDDIYRLYSGQDDTDFALPIADEKINSNANKTLSDVVKRIRTRDLPKRAFAINSNTVSTLSERTEYKVADIADRLNSSATLRQEICETAREISNRLTVEEGGQKIIDIYDIHISVPKSSVAKDLSNAFVVTSDGTFTKLSEIVRFSDWADAFSYHKWNAYVFSRADICPIVSIASKIVFERHGIKFDNEKVYKNLKTEKKILELEKILSSRQ